MSHTALILQRLVLSVTVVLAFAVFAVFSLAKEEKTEQTTGSLTLNLTPLPAAPADENQAAAEETEKNEDVAGTAKADADKKKQQQALEAMRKAMEQAQKSCEEEKRKWKERLEKDPQWQATHKRLAVIEVGEKSDPTIVRAFCLNGEGNLLVGCGGEYTEDAEGRGPNEHLEMVDGAVKWKHAVKRKAPTEIRIYSPEGKKIETWKIETEPQAICVGGDGTIIVGGAGKLIELDKDGKVLLTADAPHIGELPPSGLEPEKKMELRGEDAKAVRKAKLEKIAELQETVNEKTKEYEIFAAKLRKETDPESAESVKVYHAKTQELLEYAKDTLDEIEKIQKASVKQADASRRNRLQKMTITSIAVSGNLLFVFNSDANAIHVFAEKKAEAEYEKPESAEKPAQE